MKGQEGLEKDICNTHSQQRITRIYKLILKTDLKI